MDDGLIPNRYAKALYKAALEKDATKEVYEQMKHLSKSFVEVPSLQKAVDNPYLPSKDKEKVLLTAAGAKSQSIYAKFIELIVKNNRENFIKGMAIAYQSLYRKENGIAQVEITSAKPLTDTELDKIKKVITNYENGKVLEFTQKVDSDIIGGFIVKIDSVLLDASIKNELKKLRLKLLS